MTGRQKIFMNQEPRPLNHRASARTVLGARDHSSDTANTCFRNRMVLAQASACAAALA